MLFLSTPQPLVDTAGAFIGSFYVTAIYENPAGESDASNVVVIEDLPISTHEHSAAPAIKIGTDPFGQIGVVGGAEQVRYLWVYNMQGVLMLKTGDVADLKLLGSHSVALYGVILQDKQGNFHSQIIPVF